jgi:hypothetical protein
MLAKVTCKRELTWTDEDTSRAEQLADVCKCVLVHCCSNVDTIKADDTLSL